MARFKLDLLGSVRLTVEGQAVQSGLWAKSLGLLAFLAEENRSPHRREFLAELLWPNKSQKIAYTSLRQALNQIHKLVPCVDQVLDITTHSIKFRSQCMMELDTVLFTDLIGQTKQHLHADRSNCAFCVKRLKHAMDLYRGAFMQGYYVTGSVDFDEWLEDKRQNYQQMALSALNDLTEHHLSIGEFDLASQTARHQIAMEPYFEPAHRQLMRALFADGHRTAALDHFTKLRQMIKDDFQLQVAPETASLYRQLVEADQKNGFLSELLARPGDSNAPPVHDGNMSLFVGRKKELLFLSDHFRKALAGQTQCVFISGEAGIGKSALVGTFVRNALKTHPHVMTAFGKGNAFIGLGDPYSPFREILNDLCGLAGEVQFPVAQLPGSRQARSELFPKLVKAILRVGYDLIGVFIPGRLLLNKAIHWWNENAVGGSPEPVWLSELRRIVSRQEEQGAAHPPVTQTYLFDRFTQLVAEIAEITPLILVIDDMQWMDTASINLLFHIGKNLTNNRVMLIGAYRPVNSPSSADLNSTSPDSGLTKNLIGQDLSSPHPLEAVINELKLSRGNIELLITQEEKGFTDALIDSYPNKLGQAFRRRFDQLTKGYPLMAVELLKSLFDSGGLIRDNSGYVVEGKAINWDVLPVKIEALIKERLNRLTVTQRNILDIACIEGEFFSAEVIAALLGLTEEDVIQELTSGLGKQCNLVSTVNVEWLASGQKISRFKFNHILYQKYLYGALSPIERARRHAAVGLWLESLDKDDKNEKALILSWHYEQAGNYWKAVQCLLEAAENALNLSANQEALIHLEQGLELLKSLPEVKERFGLELALQQYRAVALTSLKGYANAEAGKATSRALKLASQIGDSQLECRILAQISGYHISRSEFTVATALIEKMIAMGSRNPDPTSVALGHWALGTVDCFRGDFVSSKRHVEYALEKLEPVEETGSTPQFSEDPYVASLSVYAVDLMALGFPDQALKQARLAVELARGLNNPIALALSLTWISIIYGNISQFEQLKITAEELIELCKKYNFVYWLSGGLHSLGLALGHLGEGEKGVNLLSEAMAMVNDTDVRVSFGIMNSMRAEIMARHGRVADAYQIIQQEADTARQKGEGFFIPEILRIQAETLMLMKSPQMRLAEEIFLESIQMARAQQARFFELKSALGLANLWASQNMSRQARLLLSDILNQMTEGFEVPVVKAAIQFISNLS